MYLSMLGSCCIKSWKDDVAVGSEVQRDKVGGS